MAMMVVVIFDGGDGRYLMVMLLVHVVGWEDWL